MKYILIIAALVLASCQKDETISGKVNPTEIWSLVEMNGKEIAGGFTINFPQKGQVAGQVFCNSYFAEQTAPLPWFEIGVAAVTRKACLDEDAQQSGKTEQLYFKTLEAVTQIERTKDTLLLTNESGASLEFRLKDKS